MEKSKSTSAFNLIALSLLIFLFGFFMYAFLHEGGHAMAGTLFGQSLAEFDVSFWDLSAHVGMTGGDLSDGQQAVVSAAGVLLPLLVWILFIHLVPRKSNFTLELLKLISSMTVINTLLAWIILPLLFLAGNAPVDDVTNFLRYSQMPPLLLSAMALILYFGGWLIFLSRIESLRSTFLLFRNTDPAALQAGARKTVPVLAGITALCAVVILAIHASTTTGSLNKLSPPRGFQPVARLDLSTQPYPGVALAEFTLDRADYAGVFIVVREIDTTYLDLSVLGEDGFTSTVLHGEGYNASRDGGLWEKNLPAGTYRLVLTSHQSPGTVSVYLHVP
jgi:hypothetical protein